MPIVFKTKKCTKQGCPHGDKEQKMSEFRALRGDSTTDQCLTCRNQTKDWKDKHPDGKTEKYISPNRMDNKFIDGVEHSWCCGHQNYHPISNFTRDSSSFTGFRRSCSTYTNALQKINRQKKKAGKVSA